MRSFLSYKGGKSKLTKQIVPLIPEHHCYCEAFTGAGWVLFAKDPSEVEIINDVNGDLVTLYRVIKLHLREFVRYLEWTLVARDEFERLKHEAPETLTDIQRAVRFFYLIKVGYAGKLTSQSFSAGPARRPSLNLLRIEESLSDIHLRLAQVTIENLDYRKVFERFDRPDTFFYIDPPYYGYENDYGKGLFSREDFDALRSIMDGLNGKFLLSINDTKETRTIFKGFHIQPVTVPYMQGKQAKELLIYNYEPPRV